MVLGELKLPTVYPSVSVYLAVQYLSLHQPSTLPHTNAISPYAKVEPLAQLCGILIFFLQVVLKESVCPELTR